MVLEFVICLFRIQLLLKSVEVVISVVHQLQFLVASFLAISSLQVLITLYQLRNQFVCDEKIRNHWWKYAWYMTVLEFTILYACEFCDFWTVDNLVDYIPNFGKFRTCVCFWNCREILLKIKFSYTCKYTFLILKNVESTNVLNFSLLVQGRSQVSSWGAQIFLFYIFWGVD